MREYNFNEETARRKLYEKGFSIPTAEMSREVYLRSLSANEREALIHLSSQVFESIYTNTIGIGLLAIGTTTYPNDYWADLEKTLALHDPSKLSFVQRRGEDIDLMIFEDHFSHNPEMILEWPDFIKQDLEEKGVPYVFNKDKKENGTGYLVVPTNIKKVKRKVFRRKLVDYGLPNFVIQLPQSRKIHLCIESCLSGNYKIDEERIQANPFSLLFRHSEYWDLKAAAQRVSKQGELFLHQ
ncbi:hypothetical protein KW787_00035 [Candidatus Pacearchaeota archaeon]|nr:hypothetical protein [Candidatus Pacearchaeota archaeon]